jgi:chromate transporter
MNAQAPPARGSIGELTVYFLRLGLLGFGGPVALVGQMERELVAERGWLSSEQMRESIAICQSLPGPLAIQVGIYISYLRGGFWGAWAGGWAFVLPNFVIVAALGALYVYLGDLQPVTAIFYGVSPAVIALILHSCYRLAKLGHGRSGAVGDCGDLSRRHRHSECRGRAVVHRRRRRRHSLLWQSPSA